MKVKLFVCICVGLFFSFVSADANAQKRQTRRPPLRVCGDPTVRCVTEAEFAPHQLPFSVSFKNGVIQEGEWFYAVVLKSFRVADDNCEQFVPEDERLETQKLFPRNKVFASRCFEPGDSFYENINPETRFMAVFAGRTKAEADKILARAKESFPQAYLRRTRTGFNGT
jgi:hypothetical protein